MMHFNVKMLVWSFFKLNTREVNPNLPHVHSNSGTVVAIILPGSLINCEFSEDE